MLLEQAFRQSPLADLIADQALSTATPGKACGPPFPTDTHSLTVMDRTTTIGFVLTLLLCWAPGGLIAAGRQTAAPITPFTSLAR